MLDVKLEGGNLLLGVMQFTAAPPVLYSKLGPTGRSPSVTILAPR
jgi:hypothetical protein